jgi:RNA polymerase sigma factor (sigma-70 family)
MIETSKEHRFTQAVTPHLDSAYNLAFWLTRSATDASDVVHEAYLRAFKYFDGFHGENPRGWLLSMVRNACFAWLKQHPDPDESAGRRVGDTRRGMDRLPHSSAIPGTVDDLAIHLAGEGYEEALNAVIQALPVEYREILVLREIESLSYREIAEITAIPIGTVMSRLAQARRLLRAAWHRHEAEE